MAGTPAYMAPEMMGGRPDELSVRTDVYLLGSTLHCILVRRPPHDAPDPADVLQSIDRSEPAIPGSVPEELAAICRRAMERDPARRFASVGEMHAALDGFLEHRASHRIAAEAERGLDQLLELTRDETAGADRRRQIHAVLGACRFGFRHALSTWPGNQPARRGLARALEATARWELRREDAEAAGLLADEMEDPPADLREAIERQRLAEEERRGRIAELERLERDLDPNVATGGRSALLAVVFGIWAVGPFLTAFRIHVFDRPHTPRELLVWPLGWIALVALTGWRHRHDLRQSVVNRRVFAGMLFLGVAQLGLHTGLVLASIPVPLFVGFDCFLGFCVASAFAATIDRGFAISAVGFMAGSLATLTFPSVRFWILTATNLLLLANFLYLRRRWLHGRPAELR